METEKKKIIERNNTKKPMKMNEGKNEMKRKQETVDRIREGRRERRKEKKLERTAEERRNCTNIGDRNERKEKLKREEPEEPRRACSTNDTRTNGRLGVLNPGRRIAPPPINTCLAAGRPNERITRRQGDEDSKCTSVMRVTYACSYVPSVCVSVC